MPPTLPMPRAPLSRCHVCAGLSPATRAVCLHCDAALVTPRAARLARVLGRLLVAGGALITLMACYGAMPHRGGPYEACGGGDQDRDGVCADRDCDDARVDVFPGAADPDLDGVDQNCDGVDGWRDPATMAAPAEAETPPPDAAPPPTPIATDPP